MSDRAIWRVSQAQADEAAAEAAGFWPEFARRWPWTRAPAVAAVYQLAGEQTVALLRAFPALQWSNQARWYRRVVRDTPALLALTPDALREEARQLAPDADPRAVDGKSALTLVYLPESDASVPLPHPPTAPPASTEPSVAKTLLASTLLDAPLYHAQLAHELLNCFCYTTWDGTTLRNGLRQTSGVGGANVLRAEHGAALNDLLLDAILVHYLPAATPLSLDDLLGGAQGPYWRIAQTLSERLRGTPVLSALFSGSPDALARFEQGIAVALDTADAASRLDALATAHDWAGLTALLDAS